MKYDNQEIIKLRRSIQHYDNTKQDKSVYGGWHKDWLAGYDKSDIRQKATKDTNLYPIKTNAERNKMAKKLEVIAQDILLADSGLNRIFDNLVIEMYVDQYKDNQEKHQKDGHAETRPKD